jgi:hypothetical protein
MTRRPGPAGCRMGDMVRGCGQGTWSGGLGQTAGTRTRRQGTRRGRRRRFLSEGKRRPRSGRPKPTKVVGGRPGAFRAGLCQSMQGLEAAGPARKAGSRSRVDPRAGRPIQAAGRKAPRGHLPTSCAGARAPCRGARARTAPRRSGPRPGPSAPHLSVPRAASTGGPGRSASAWIGSRARACVRACAIVCARGAGLYAGQEPGRVPPLPLRHLRRTPHAARACAVPHSSQSESPHARSRNGLARRRCGKARGGRRRGRQRGRGPADDAQPPRRRAMVAHGNGLAGEEGLGRGGLGRGGLWRGQAAEKGAGSGDACREMRGCMTMTHEGCMAMMAAHGNGGARQWRRTARHEHCGNGHCGCGH